MHLIKHGIDPSRADPGHITIAFIPGSIPEAIPKLVQQDQSQGAGSWDQSWFERAGSPILHPSTPPVSRNHTLFVCPQLPPTPTPRQPSSYIVALLPSLLGLGAALDRPLSEDALAEEKKFQQREEVSAEYRTC